MKYYDLKSYISRYMCYLAYFWTICQSPLLFSVHT